MAEPPGPSLRSLLSFPDPVNEVSARLVAGGVALLMRAGLIPDTMCERCHDTRSAGGA